MTDIWDEYKELSRGDDFNARERFMLRDDIPDALIQEILDSEGDLGILASLASNPSVKKSFLEGMMNYEYAISEDEDPDKEILRGLAENPNAGEEILNSLAENEDEEIAEIAQGTIENLS